LTETTDTSTNTQSTLTTELNGNLAEGLVTGWDKCELSTGEDERRESSEFRLGEYTTRVDLHHVVKLESGELSVEIDNGTNTDQLHIGTGLENGGHGIGNKIDTLLHRPATNKDKQISIGVKVETGPFLGLPFEIRTAGLVGRVHGDILILGRLLGPLADIRWIGVRQVSDLAQAPENGVTGIRTLSVLLGHTDSTETLLVNTEVTGTGVEQVENLSELDVPTSDILVEVENRADLDLFLKGSHRPKTLEFGIV
jgi:hypothetical protein